MLTYDVRYTENHPGELSEVANTSLAGLGIGLLVSIAISLSSKLADLILAHMLSAWNSVW